MNKEEQLNQIWEGIVEFLEQSGNDAAVIRNLKAKMDMLNGYAAKKKFADKTMKDIMGEVSEFKTAGPKHPPLADEFSV